MRKYETNWRLATQPELRNDGFEIMTVGTQAMQPYHTASRLCVRLDLNSIRQFHRVSPSVNA